MDAWMNAWMDVWMDVLWDQGRWHEAKYDGITKHDITPNPDVQ